MNREKWHHAKEVFGRALELESGEREALLAEVRASDPEVAREVESLLGEALRPGEFLPDLSGERALNGRRLGPWRFVRLLGDGGMGSVYLAERSDGAYEQQVAVKLLRPAFHEGGTAERFDRERRILAKLDHPAIARLLDGGSMPDGTPYLIMEFVKGVPIDRYCASEALDARQIAELMEQLCAGVAHAHHHLVVHRDLKPGNVLVDAEGRVKLLDFGIAKLLDPGGGTQVTLPALNAATPAYASPEQLRGDPIGTASDIYSAGVLLYHLLTGRAPYALGSGGIEELVAAVLHRDPVRPSAVAASGSDQPKTVDADLENIVLMALRKNPAERYPTMEAFAQDLRRYREGYPVSARPISAPSRAFRFLRRHRAASAAATVFAVGLCATGGLAWRSELGARAQGEKAQRRFNDLRQFAHTVLTELDGSLATVPGTTASRKLLVETALRYLDGLSKESGNDPVLQIELANAYMRVGKIQGGMFVPNLGDTHGARRSFRAALEALAAAGNSPNAAVQRTRMDASISLAYLEADPAAAIPHFAEAIRAGTEILRQRPDEVETLRLTADAYHGWGTAGHLTDRVLEHEEKSLEQIRLRERICRLRPNDAQARTELARATTQLALAREQAGKYGEAFGLLDAGRRQVEAAIREQPGNQIRQRELAEKYSRAGSVLRKAGRLAESKASIEKAMAILDALSAPDPKNIQYRRDLSYAWFRYADTLKAMGRSAEAARYHERTLALRREWGARDAGNTFIQWELARSLNAVAGLRLSARPAEAAALYREAEGVAARALARAPSFNEMRRQWIHAQTALAGMLLAEARKAAASERMRLDSEARTAVTSVKAAWELLDRTSQNAVDGAEDRAQLARLEAALR